MVEVSLMSNSKYLMIVGGVWRASCKNTKLRIIYNLYGLIIQLVYSTLCFLMCVEFFYLLRDKDMKKLTNNIKITITCSLAAIKSIMFQTGRIPELINIIIKEENNILTSKDREIRKIYLTYVKYIDRIFIAIVTLSGGTAAFLVVATSLVGMTRKNDPLSERPMILLAHYPFDQREHYGASLILQGVSVFFGLIYFCMSQILYMSLLIFVKSQLRILQHMFGNFDQYKQTIFPDIDDINMMKNLIRFHQSIIRFVAELNNSLKFLLLIEFLLSSLNIASVAFQLIAVQTITDVSFSVSYLMVLIGQLFILAWHANEISVESIAVSTALYEFPWYEKSIEVQRILHLVILRSQKPLTLTIGPFKPLTTQSVIAVINAAYSYVTIMTSNY